MQLLRIRGPRLVHVARAYHSINLFAQSTKRGDPVSGTNTPSPAPVARPSDNLSAGDKVLTVILTVGSTQNLKEEKLNVWWPSAPRYLCDKSDPQNRGSPLRGYHLAGIRHYPFIGRAAAIVASKL